MEKNREYLSEQLVAIIAPAGYGKTEEIAEAIKECDEKQLILTHTNAGVDTLQDRLKVKNIGKNKYELDTIASFCMKWCKAYPVSSNTNISQRVSEIDFLEIYEGTRRLFSKNWARQILKQTYSGIFIDEYQDCTLSQHDLFMELKDIVPVRIYGDPLQGIFYWVDEDKIVDWKTFSFKVIRPLKIPYRWENTNIKLGSLLDALRKKILPVLDGKEVTINLRDIPGCMVVLNSQQWDNGRFVYKIKHYEDIVYLSRFQNKQQSFSRHNGGFFQCDEVKDLAEVEKIVISIETEKNEKKALMLLKTLKSMINGIQSELGPYIKNLEKGKADFTRIKKHKEVGMLIKEICINNSKESVLELLRWFWESKEFNVYRKEMLYRTGKIYAYMTEEGVCLEDALEMLSTRQYFTGSRFLFSRISSRTVLTKGLEFDCVIIDARDKMDARDFYVAMTRAKRHIYVISDTNKLCFDGISYAQ